MPKLKKVIIQVHEQDGSTTEVEIDKQFIEFYRKETGRNNISARALSKFIDHLVELHNHPVN